MLMRRRLGERANTWGARERGLLAGAVVMKLQDVVMKLADVYRSMEVERLSVDDGESGRDQQ
jgi:hypothetical protein